MSEPVTLTHPEEKAGEIAEHVIATLSMRSGFDSFWDELPEETAAEIRAELAKRITDCLLEGDS